MAAGFLVGAGWGDCMREASLQNRVNRCCEALLLIVIIGGSLSDSWARVRDNAGWQSDAVGGRAIPSHSDHHSLRGAGTVAGSRKSLPTVSGAVHLPTTPLMYKPAASSIASRTIPPMIATVDSDDVSDRGLSEKSAVAEGAGARLSQTRGGCSSARGSA